MTLKLVLESKTSLAKVFGKVAAFVTYALWFQTEMNVRDLTGCEKIKE